MTLRERIVDELIYRQRAYAFWSCGHEPNAACHECRAAWGRVVDVVVSLLPIGLAKLE